MSYTKHIKTVGVIGVAAIATPFIGNFEGYSGKVYYDVVGVPTQCFGETKKLDWNKEKTREECKALLDEEVRKYIEAVDALVIVPINTCQRASLTSMSYNVGVDNFRRSTLLRKLNAGDYQGAANEFDRWVFAGGIKFKGLLRRRAAEKELFLNDCTNMQRMQNQIHK